MNDSKKIYFPNLDGIRFFAAFLVIIHHIEQTRYGFNALNYWDNELIRSLGRLGVILFFVLSGFLISYLLFKEKVKTNTIQIRKFYMRRILRIWPLYFLIVLFSLFVFPGLQILDTPYGKDPPLDIKVLKALPLYVLFLPNLVLVLMDMIPYCSQTWSIGAEEQFYLIWPALIKYLNNIVILVFSIVLVYLAVKFALLLGILGEGGENTLFYRFWDTMPLHFMAIGAFFAYVSFYSTKLTRFLSQVLYSRIFQVLTFAVLILFPVYGIKIKYVNLECYAAGFGVIILNASTGPKNIFRLDLAPLRYLGKISYGLYMYHSIGIVLAIKLLGFFMKENSTSLIYILSLVFTIVLSTISYYTFETFFLNLKKKFTIVRSGNNN